MFCSVEVPFENVNRFVNLAELLQTQLLCALAGGKMQERTDLQDSPCVEEVES